MTTGRQPDDPEREKKSEELREKGVPAHEWRLYRKGMS